MMFITLYSALTLIALLPNLAITVLAAIIPSPAYPARVSSRQISRFLYAHNIVRSAHGAEALIWSRTLAGKAQEWADTCQFKHSDGTLLDTPYGENIVAATGVFPIAAAINTFVSQASNYDPASPTYNHFTQVIWKSTTQVGCAISKCDGIFDPKYGKATNYVCLYNPAGNIVGEALANVQV